MPLVPSVPGFPPQPPQPVQNPQSSPGLPNNGARRTPPISSVPTRLLPTPPHNNPPTFEGERRLTPPPGPVQTMSAPNVNQHYPARSAPRGVSQAYPSRLQNFEDNWQMTPELLAEIERADQQQAQYQSTLPLGYPSAPQSESPPATKGPNVDRVRGAAERSSPINPDNTQQRGRREQQIPRESPKTRDRHPTSPISQTYDPSLTPERRLSPVQLLESQSLPPNYASIYNPREPVPVMRRAPASEQRLNGSVQNQSQPPAIAARNPDRSLPVQEEDENGGHRSEWQDNDTMVESSFSSSSPTPSSDLNPDGNSQRFDNNSQTSVHDEDENENEKPIQEDRSQYNNRDSTEEDSGTPKSPTVALPRDSNESYYPGANMPIRVPAQPVPLRPSGRNGPTDHIMRGLETTLMENKQPQPLQPSSVPNSQNQQQLSQAGQKFLDPRQQYAPQPHQYPKYPMVPEYAYDLPRDRNGRYLPPQPQVYPDDFHSYDDSNSSYIASYLPSPRPDAPVPPTPQSQTAAPSPSPLEYNGVPKSTGTPGYRPPVRAAGSPYPFPFNHVRRNRQNQNSRLIANGLDPATITEQIARQWQVFAQNNQGNITDSTLSPSTTPFQADLFDHWAYLHTNRMMRGMHDTASMHSSPSHQPIPLPAAPPHFGVKKKSLSAKRQAYTRKPPPRVESTQPRDTSPEVSSGEETAGDERVNRNATPDLAMSVTPTDVDAPSVTEIPIENLVVDDQSAEGEWVDEEDEDDYDDLIDLEYHPSFVKNVSKRRRRWEVGWENMIQAFQALDRQTDATMILLASPSHTTKLHALRSRSIRRTSSLYNSANMNDIRASFSRMSTQRRKTRPERSSLVDRLASVSGTSNGDGSDGSSASVEENLRRALDAALGSLGALGEVYEQRETRVLEELQRSREDRERVELLLRQVLGDKNPLSSPVSLFSA
ncbi:hypothetical protein CPB83DRAFT_787553 [Crepidotus variabilis]|uniref:Uncharacterized protein n=1 Tax=Crepidotus variabilis TaxID=179855 RepID=A0A9P6JRL8_9AGAR|nr:hypothetical protein CPB83DRAFT_787553 [Crepidotus variabilis]